jgi:hypothetical protein
VPSAPRARIVAKNRAYHNVHGLGNLQHRLCLIGLLHHIALRVSSARHSAITLRATSARGPNLLPHRLPRGRRGRRRLARDVSSAHGDPLLMVVSNLAHQRLPVRRLRLHFLSNVASGWHMHKPWPCPCPCPCPGTCQGHVHVHVVDMCVAGMWHVCCRHGGDVCGRAGDGMGRAVRCAHGLITVMAASAA